jgi:MFS family permease
MIDRIGRRKLMISSALIMAMSQFIIGGLASVEGTNVQAAKASIAFYFTAMYAFPTGLFLIPFMYSAEIAPLEIRHQITAMSSFANWIFNFMLAEVSPTAFDSIGFKYYFVYGSTSFALFIALIFLYPETLNRTLEEIDDIFIQAKGPLDTVRIAKTLPFQEKVMMNSKSEWQQKPESEFIEKA